MTIISPLPKLQFFTVNGDPLVGGKLYTYEAGTTTPLATYTDSTGATANTNPVILDARGEASVWLTSALGYKFVVKNANDELIYTVDNINGDATPEDFTTASAVAYLPGGSGAVLTNVQAKLRQTVSVKDFGAIGNGVTDDTAAIQAAINAVGVLGGGTVNFVNGETYLVSNIILLRTNVSLVGNGCTISVNPLNYTGGITQFYGVFSTVNITNRPLPVLWRIGTGVISFENIQIDGFTFQINRDGNVLTFGQMDVADINIVRFEDARNCKITNCRFIDGETISNNNGDQVVYFVRSEMCEISYCYAENTTLIYLAECKNCTVANNVLPVSVGTTIEAVAGQSLTISGNKLGVTWWSVSSIGINTRQCRIIGNTIDESALTGITVGHPTLTGNANFYNLPLDANFSICSDNYIMSGGSTTASHGYIGVLVQAASYVTISNNTILSLRKRTSYLDQVGGVLVQPNTAIEAAGLRIEKNRVSTANNGIALVRIFSATVSENSINDVYGGIVQLSPGDVPILTVQGNIVTSAERAVSFFNGFVVATSNYFTNITDASFALAFSLGNFRVENNFLSECGEMFFSVVKSVSLIGNVIENAVVKTRAGTLDNTSTAGTATIDQIAVYGNLHPGTTDMLRITNVLGQSTRVLEVTVPTQFRTTSYNVGSLPTAATGLLTGDLWNNAGTVRVV